MSASTVSWAAQQLPEFMAAISSSPDEPAALRAAVECSAELLEAEVGAVLFGAVVAAQIGYPAGAVPDADLVAVAAAGSGTLRLARVGRAYAAAAPMPGGTGGYLVVARAAAEFSAEERILLRGMGRVLSLVLRQIAMLAAERELRAERERQIEENERLVAALQERQRLLEQLFLVQRAIADRAPLPDVLDAITRGASELFDGDEVALRLIDSDDDGYLVMPSSYGLAPEMAAALLRCPASAGLGGAVLARGELIWVDDYDSAVDVIPEFAGRGLSAMMGAPVRENGVVVGNLLVASRQPGRRYLAAHHQMLLRFADQVSLALTDARGTEAFHHAFHDNLTGLPNRMLLLDRLGQALAQARRGHGGVAVLFLDLDGFKSINDRLGHAAGDQLLIEVGRRLRGVVRAADTAARLGGDEFVVLLTAAADGLAVEADAAATAERILTALRDPVLVADRSISVAASVGMAVSQYGREDAAELLGSADQAMYRAKGQGSGRSQMFGRRSG